MKFISAASMLFSLFPQAFVASTSVFETSPFDQEKSRLVQIYEARLNQTFVGSFNLLEKMYEDQILEGDGESALARILGYSILDPSILTKPASCRADSFGLHGRYTDAVCDAVDAVQVACLAEPGCDVAKIPNVVSASAEQFLLDAVFDPDEFAIKGLMKTAICLYRVVNNHGGAFTSVNACLDPYNLPDDADLADGIENYHLIMAYILIPERTNPLWTNAAAITSKFIDPNACFVLGD